MTNFYCMRCKKNVEIENKNTTKHVTKKNNLQMLKSKCPKCGTRICKIIGKDKERELPELERQ